MPQYNAGNILREYRLKNNIKQNLLCNGLCTPATLCKIEKGDLDPSYKMFEALMQRAGAPLSIFNISIPNEEFMRLQVEEEIDSLWANANFEIGELLEKYKNCSPLMNKLEQQRYLFDTTLYESKQGKSKEELLAMCLDAIHITVPNFTLDSDFSQYLFTLQEIEILQAIIVFSENEWEISLKLMSSLETYFQTHNMDSEIYARHYPAIAINLSTRLGMSKKYNEALIIASRGLDCCIKYDKLAAFPNLLYTKGFTLVCLEKKQQGQRMIRHSLEILKEMHHQDYFDIFREDIITSFGQDFWNELGVS